MIRGWERRQILFKQWSINIQVIVTSTVALVCCFVLILWSILVLGYIILDGVTLRMDTMWRSLQYKKSLSCRRSDRKRISEFPAPVTDHNVCIGHHNLDLLRTWSTPDHQISGRRPPPSFSCPASPRRLEYGLACHWSALILIQRLPSANYPTTHHTKFYISICMC